MGCGGGWLGDGWIEDGGGDLVAKSAIYIFFRIYKSLSRSLAGSSSFSSFQITSHKLLKAHTGLTDLTLQLPRFPPLRCDTRCPAPPPPPARLATPPPVAAAHPVTPAGVTSAAALGRSLGLGQSSMGQVMGKGKETGCSCAVCGALSRWKEVSHLD